MPKHDYSVQRFVIGMFLTVVKSENKLNIKARLRV